MKKILSVVAVLVLSVCAFAQSTGKITGLVKSADGKPMTAVTIELLKAIDSSIVRSTFSDKDGKFEISNAPSGDHILAVSAIGYGNYISGKITVNAGATVLNDVVLSIAAKGMQEVKVVSKKPMFEQKAGKMLVNVDASPTNSGLTALELLEKSPGVSVDSDGNISLKGKQGVTILIDGKPTYLSGAELTALLKTVQSNNLEQIEIMTNPPAKFDAAGNSGVINIKTKKSVIKGMNGNAGLGYTQGVYGRVNGNLNLNYRNNKLNVFGGYSYGTYEGFNSMTILRNFYQADKTTLDGYSDQYSRPYFGGENHSAKVGMDYYFSKKDVIGVVVNSYFSNGFENPTSLSYVRDANGNVLYRLNSTSDNTYTFGNVSTNLNYKHTFDSTGRELSMDADYITYDKHNKTKLMTQSYDGHGNPNANEIILKGDIPSTVNIYSGKMDYVHPFKSGLKLEAGIKSSFVKTNNKVDYIRDNGSGWNYDDRSNHFLYDENINAAYAVVNKSIKKWSVNAGLRVENTVSEGKQVRNDSSFRNVYTDVFPNLGVSYSASDKHQFNLTYSKRIDRPDYDDLNPFTFFLDSLTYGKGNPYLRPQYTNNVEVSYTFNKALTATVNYSHTNDIITQLLKQDTENKITFQTSENMSEMSQIGITLMYNKVLWKWWNTNIYANVNSNHYIGFYNSDPIDLTFTNFQTNISNNFTLGKGWSAELSGFYRSKGAWGLFQTDDMMSVNAGFSKQVLKKKGSIKFSARDIFYTMGMDGGAKYSDVNVSIHSRRDTRQFNLSFTYRFGKSNIAPERKRSGGAGDEQNRVKGAGS